ncbi:DcaP family trimeric outer membrane transporter [Paracoccus sp. J39]|uniref:DcaP family trimeric outer membrane transporter n=1 Tax=Paracoccus sp. J39 TaxID=935848 RepID=UPI0012EBB723|nr:DcaP family trimeric outer membrane transporter [Paracoccus sp. J39]
MRYIKMKTGTILSGAVLGAAAWIGFSGTAAAQDLRALEARIAALEAEQAAAPGVIANPGVKLTFYGFTKLDVISDNNYDLGNTTGGMAGVNATSLKDRSTGAHAYESRLGVKGSVDTDIGPLKFNIEGDFYGGGGGTFRLRHAYGEVGPLLAGQTWTNWVPAEGGPGAVQDFNGPAGGSYYRTPQVRFTYKPNENWRFSAAIEEDVAPGSASNLALTGFAGYSTGRLKLGMGVMSRSLETAGNDSVRGLGYAIGADFEAWEGGKLQLQYLGGKGIATALSNSAFAGLEVGAAGKYAFDIDANGDAIKVNTMKAGVTQKLGEKSDISVAYSFQRYDDYAGADASYTKKLSSAYLTYRYFPTKPLMLAAEVAWGEREQFDGTSFDNTRLQGVVKFTF